MGGGMGGVGGFEFGGLAVPGPGWRGRCCGSLARGASWLHATPKLLDWLSLLAAAIFKLAHLEQHVACFNVAADGGPVQRRAALLVGQVAARAQHQQQAQRVCRPAGQAGRQRQCAAFEFALIDCDSSRLPALERQYTIHSLPHMLLPLAAPLPFPARLPHNKHQPNGPPAKPL
jgi:hypothetical protein